MDTYQPIFDAVRSRISNADIGEAVQDSFRDANICHYAAMAAENIRVAFSDYSRPSAIYRPVLSADGNQWCALYGENLHDGIAGFGDTAEQAMLAFDKAWHTEKCGPKRP